MFHYKKKGSQNSGSAHVVSTITGNLNNSDNNSNNIFEEVSNEKKHYNNSVSSPVNRRKSDYGVSIRRNSTSFVIPKLPLHCNSDYQLKSSQKVPKSSSVKPTTQINTHKSPLKKMPMCNITFDNFIDVIKKGELSDNKVVNHYMDSLYRYYDNHGVPLDPGGNTILHLIAKTKSKSQVAIFQYAIIYIVNKDTAWERDFLHHKNDENLSFFDCCTDLLTCGSLVNVYIKQIYQKKTQILDFSDFLKQFENITDDANKFKQYLAIHPNIRFFLDESNKENILHKLHNSKIIGEVIDEILFPKFSNNSKRSVINHLLYLLTQKNIYGQTPLLKAMMLHDNVKAVQDLILVIEKYRKQYQQLDTIFTDIIKTDKIKGNIYEYMLHYINHGDQLISYWPLLIKMIPNKLSLMTVIADIVRKKYFDNVKKLGKEIKKQDKLSKEYLLNYYTDINKFLFRLYQGAKGNNLLHILVTKEDICTEIISDFLETDFKDPSIINSSSSTSSSSSSLTYSMNYLSIATISSNLNMLTNALFTLIQPNEKGLSPFMKAFLISKNTNIIQHLVKICNKYDNQYNELKDIANICTASKETILHLMYQKTHLTTQDLNEYTKILLSIGINPNVKNLEQETALHIACFRQVTKHKLYDQHNELYQQEIRKYFMCIRQDIEIQKSNKTDTKKVDLQKVTDIVASLKSHYLFMLIHGSDVSSVNANNHTAIDIAALFGNMFFIEFLRFYIYALQQEKILSEDGTSKYKAIYTSLKNTNYKEDEQIMTSKILYKYNIDLERYYLNLNSIRVFLFENIFVVNNSIDIFYQEKFNNISVNNTLILPSAVVNPPQLLHSSSKFYKNSSQASPTHKQHRAEPATMLSKVQQQDNMTVNSSSSPTNNRASMLKSFGGSRDYLDPLDRKKKILSGSNGRLSFQGSGK